MINRTTFGSGSTLHKHLLWVKPPTEYNVTQNWIYSTPCSCGKVYKGETYRPLKARLQEHRKAVGRGEIEKSDMIDHIWKEKGKYLPLWYKVKIIDREGHWKRRCLTEAAHVLGHVDLLSRPDMEMNTIWEPIIERPNQIAFKENYFKNIKNNWCHWILRFKFISWRFSRNFLRWFSDW